MTASPTGTLTKKIERHCAAEDVGRHQHAAQDLAGHGADRQRDRVQPDGPHALGALEGQLDAGQRLGEHQRGAGALQHARGDQRDRAGREAAQQRGAREDAHAEQEHAPVAVESAPAARR